MIKVGLLVAESKSKGDKLVRMLSDVVKNFALHGRKVVAIGRNYKMHAEELKNAIPTEPFWFLKPPSAFVQPVSP